MRIMFMDLEVQNHAYYGAVASPRHPENYVVLNGWAIDTQPYDGAIEYLHNTSLEQAKSRPWVTIPEDVGLLVCHNAPFELDWMLHQQRDVIASFLKRGGRVICTAYAHYLLSNQRDTYPPLDEIAPLYGGEHKVDGIKALWEQGVKTADIDPSLLIEYLISPTKGDIANTRKIFYGQYAQLAERGMWEMFLDRMEGMVFDCFCMDAGLMIDRDTAERQRSEGEARLKQLRYTFRDQRKDYPDLVEFKESSDFHMSAWLYGGPIKYRHRVPRFKEDGTPYMAKCDAVKWGDTYLPLVDGKLALNVQGEVQYFDPEYADQTFKLDLARYKSGKNKGVIKVERIDTTTQDEKWEETAYQAPALCDLKLLPDVIREEFLKENTGKRVLRDGSPVISSAKEALTFLVNRKEFPSHVQQVLQDLAEFNKVDKDMGTYYLREETDDDGRVVKRSGMLQYMTPVGIVHHVLNSTATSTTRKSSNKPNLQNLPRGNTSDVKGMFVSRYDKPEWLDWALANNRVTKEFHAECTANIIAGLRNGWIVELDYSALEVVTLAAFSQDKALINALLNDTDMHCLRLSKKLGEPYEDVVKKCKDKAHPENARYDLMRTLIKPPSFAYQYGATAMGISYSTGMPLEEAEEFIRNEKELFPDVERFYSDKVFPEVESSKTMHREMMDDGSWVVYGRGVWRAPAGTCYEFRQYPKTKTVFEGGQRRRINVMEFKPTQMRNYPIQGESGFFVQGISGQVMRWLVANDFFGGRVYAINTVHDALYLDCHRSVLDVVCGGVKSIMESLPQYFSGKYGYTLNVPFPAAAEFGGSMQEKIHWHPGALADHETTKEVS